MRASSRASRAIDCDANIAHRQSTPLPNLPIRPDGFLEACFEEYVGGSPGRAAPEDFQKKSDALSRPEILKLRPPKKNKFVDAPLNAQHRKKLPSKMSDYASLLATIAGLQEQVNTMNGQLTEVRLSCPFP